MASTKPVEAISQSALNRRLAKVEALIEAGDESPQVLMDRIEIRAEIRRRKFDSNGDLSEDEAKALKEEAKGDIALRQWILANQPIDPSVRLLEGIDTMAPINKKPAPTFSVLEVAKCFFGRSSHWIRWLEREGQFVLDGKPVGERRSGTGSRCYSLGDIEEIAHALYQNNAIDQTQLVLAITNVRNIAIMVGIL